MIYACADKLELISNRSYRFTEEEDINLASCNL